MEEYQQPEPSEEPPSQEADLSREDLIAQLETAQAERDQVKTQYAESSKEAQRLYHEKQDSERREAEARQLYMQQVNAQPDPTAEKHKAALDEAGLTDAISHLIQTESANVIRQELGPVIQAFQAQQQIDMNVEGFAKNRAEIYDYLNQNPSVRERYNNSSQTDPIGAAELVTLKYEKWKAGQTEEQMQGNSNQAETARREARRDAGIPASKGGRETVPVEAISKDEREYLDAALDYGHEHSNDFAPFLRERLKTQLDNLKWAEGS